MKEQQELGIKDVSRGGAEAQGYARLDGTSLEKLFLDSLAAELTRRRETAKAISEFDALVTETSARRDVPYVFNRADAYAEDVQ